LSRNRQFFFVPRAKEGSVAADDQVEHATVITFHQLIPLVLTPEGERFRRHGTAPRLRRLAWAAISSSPIDDHPRRHLLVADGDGADGDVDAAHD
jgi:hypothetical protein